VLGYRPAGSCGVERKGPNELFLRKSLVRIESEPSFMRHDLIKNITRRREVEHEQKNYICGCWDSSPGLHGHNVEFSPLNYSHFGVPATIIKIIK
jgi:hypothetical protein